MALTAKPISTISYNTENFLLTKLNDMLKVHIICDYRFIFHYGEDGDKDHYHVLLFPNKRIDTASLLDEFKEIDPNNTKPLGVLPWRASKIDHWLLYVLHDPIYLIAHGSQTDGDGKIVYPLTDIVTPFFEQLERDYRSSLHLQKTDTQKVIDGFAQGLSVIEVMYRENINPMAVNHVASALVNNANEIITKNIRTEAAKLLQGMAEMSPNNEVTVIEDVTPIGHGAIDHMTPEPPLKTITYHLDTVTGELTADDPQFISPEERKDLK